METGRRADLAAALFLGLAGVLGACAAPPLDIPRAEWSGMTADQQALAVDKAAELAAGRTQAALPETQAAIRRDAVSEAARHARVAENYTSGSATWSCAPWGRATPAGHPLRRSSSCLPASSKKPLV